MPVPLYRNMVVYRLNDGRLILHSLVALSEAGMKQLEALGRPSIMVIPHGYDGMDASWYLDRYPQAAFPYADLIATIKATGAYPLPAKEVTS